MTNPGIIFNQQLEIIIPGSKKVPYSTELEPDWDNVTYKVLPFWVSVEPSSSTEGDVSHPQTVSRFILTTPPGTDIPDLKSENRVRVGGVMVAMVVGEPAHWPDPWTPGVVHHLEADLEVIRG